MRKRAADWKGGVVKVVPEHADDLWTLSQVIEPGDRLRARTLRRIEKTGADERAKAAAKKPMMLTIEVEKIELARELRVLGTIVDGPEDVPRGEHHSLHIEPGTELTLLKEVAGYQRQRLEEAFAAGKEEVLIVVMDREEAHLARLKRQGVERLASIKGDVAKKDEQKAKTGDFYGDIIAAIGEYDQRLSPKHIIIASPAFWKEDLFARITDDKLKKRIVQATCSTADEKAFEEVLKREELRSVLAQDAAARELALVEEVLKEIAVEGKAAYGIDHVERAVEAGAVARLLVVDEHIVQAREEGSYDRLDAVMRGADKAKGEVHLISAAHEGGQKLLGLGGVAAVLRYKLA